MQLFSCSAASRSPLTAAMPLLFADALRQQSAGRVVLCPTARAMEEAFLRTGLLSSLPPAPAELAAACTQLADALPRLAVPQVLPVVCSTAQAKAHASRPVPTPAVPLLLLQSSIPSSSPCALVYPTNSVAEPLSHLLPLGPPGQRAGFAAASLGGVTSKFSILGTGYNAYVGFPISAGLNPFDPGLT